MHCVIIIMANIDTKWVKFGEIKAIAFLGKEVIAIASGIHVIFINLNTKDEKVEKFDNRERGDGASCLAGHPVVPMFAIAERCLNPKISIFTYPEINKVSSCIYNKASRHNGFISSTFAGTEYLITLTSFPDFQLIVWLWRTGENLKVIDTKIMDDMQRITCSSSSPFWLSQLGERTGQLMLYEMTVCSKIILLNPASNFITSEPIVSSSWTYDGNLLLCDDLGNVSLYYSDGKRCYVIVNSNIQQPPKSRTLVVEFRGGAVIANADCQILFYRKPTTERVKSGSHWKFIWQIETSSHPLFIIRHPYRDSLLIYTNTGEIVEVSVGDDDVPRMQMICYHGSGYTFIVPINPDGHCIGGFDTSNRLVIMNSLTGNLLSTTPLDNYGKILQAVAHNNLPLIATSTIMGKCNLISVVDVGNPIVIKSIYLTSKPLDKLKFSMTGNVLGVANITHGELFIINDVINMKFQILTVLNISASIVDFLIYKNTNGCLVILILIKAHPTIYIGKNIIIYNVNELTLVTEMEKIIELPNIFKFLHYGETEYDIIASPYLTKQLHLIKISKDYKTTTLTDALSLSHQLRDININSESRLILTFGYDGIVIIRSKTNIRSTISIFLSHHRKECGIKLAIPCLHHNIILCLGRNGNLVAIKLSQLDTILNSSLDLTNTEVDVLRGLSTFTQSKLNGEKTWIEWKHEEQLENDREKMATKRASILENFQNLQRRLQELLDNNEKESDDARLNIATFNLDVCARDEKIKLNNLKKEALMRDLTEQIYCHDKLTAYLRKTYWDSMLVPACTIISLDSEICVNNYPIPVEVSHKEKNHQEWMNFSNDISQQDSSIEKLFPIANASTGECVEAKNINYMKVNEGDKDEQLAMSGTTTHRWIHDDSSKIYDQINRDNNCIEGMAIHMITEQRKKKLKEYFNNLFENMRMKKEEKIILVNKQISRINHCLSELKEMFGIDMSVDYDNLHLNWHNTERPQTIVTVEDSEVYKLMNDSMDVSNVTCTNESTIEDKNKTSDNNFWYKTLEKIMDGVLEVRWEDEIKKDVVKPHCLSKKIENCTDEELEMIRVFDCSVENLKLERLKYKLILEKGISEIQAELRKNIENFNAQLKTFFLERIKIESAILQEDLLSLRELQRHQWHQQSVAKIQQVEYNELNPTILELKKLSEESTILELTLNETKTRYDNLIKREKLLEGKFRGEFPDLKQPMVEHLLRHYKKRPRIGQLTCTSVTYLTEMSKCIVNGEKSEILPRECVDFLKGMQRLDVMPSGLPSQIDSNHWFILCRIRRAKVEIETRLKSCAVELAEAEQTFSSYQKTIQNIQNRVHQLRETMDDIKRHNCKILSNMAVQLILKMGQIEIQLCGHSSELGNAVLVPFDEVLRVNDSIIKAGRNKVVAMNKTTMFRRTIEWREWRHRCLKLTLEDMKEDLKVLQGVKVTKEIQEYLRRYLHTNGLSKDTETWERSVMSTEKRLIHMIENEKEQLVEITKSINEWQQKNHQLTQATDKLKLDNLKFLLLVNDETRVRDEKFRRAKIKAIMKRNRLITKVQGNYNELLALRSQLELLRLKTYPTLRLKRLIHDNKKFNDN